MRVESNDRDRSTGAPGDDELPYSSSFSFDSSSLSNEGALRSPRSLFTCFSSRAILLSSF